MPDQWRRCSECQVKWHGTQLLCWCCGAPGDLCTPPYTESSLYVPISDRAWAEVRRQIGAD